MNPMMLMGAPRLRFSPSVNIVGDGNSLFTRLGTTTNANRPPDAAMALAPLAGSGAILTNIAIGGQTWRQMTGLDGGSAADVDAAWVNGKTNILLTWEGTNAIINGGRSAQEAADDMAAYFARAKSVRPWKTMVLTTIPRNGAANGAAFASQAVRDERNGVLAAYDAILRAKYRSMGIDVLCDVRRPGSPFAFANYLQASWDATRGLWFEAQGQEIHQTDAGAAVIASYIASDIRRMPR